MANENVTTIDRRVFLQRAPLIGAAVGALAVPTATSKLARAICIDVDCRQQCKPGWHWDTSSQSCMPDGPPPAPSWAESPVSTSLYSQINPQLQNVINAGTPDVLTSADWNNLSGLVQQLAIEHANLGNIANMDAWLRANLDVINWYLPAQSADINTWCTNGTWWTYSQTVQIFGVIGGTAVWTATQCQIANLMFAVYAAAAAAMKAWGGPLGQLFGTYLAVADAVYKIVLVARGC